MPAGDPSSRATARTGEVWEHGARRWSRSDQLVGGDDNDRAAEMLGLVPGCRVLDAGCVAGHRLGPLAATGAHVVGVDISPAMLQLASGTGLLARLVRADVTNLPFHDDAFEAALCAYVLDFTPAVAAALRELHRVVRPGGRLLVSLLGAVAGPRRATWHRFIGQSTPASGPLPWELEPLLTHHAWHLVYQEGIFGQDRDGNTNPVSDPTVVDPTTWTPGLQALANGWRFLAIDR
jgi:SAM-dependent methyltransferase